MLVAVLVTGFYAILSGDKKELGPDVPLLPGPKLSDILLVSMLLFILKSWDVATPALEPKLAVPDEVPNLVAYEDLLL